MLVSQILKRKMAKSCIGSDDIVILMARKIIPNNFVMECNNIPTKEMKQYYHNVHFVRKYIIIIIIMNIGKLLRDSL